MKLKDWGIVLLSVALSLTISILVLRAGNSSGMTSGNNLENVRPMASVVVEIDEESDTVVCEDFTGNLWAFYGTDDWEINDVCVLMMNNQEIADVWYSGTMW